MDRGREKEGKSEQPPFLPPSEMTARLSLNPKAFGLNPWVGGGEGGQSRAGLNSTSSSSLSPPPPLWHLPSSFPALPSHRVQVRDKREREYCRSNHPWNTVAKGVFAYKKGVAKTKQKQNKKHIQNVILAVAHWTP